jgi:ABC-type Na+ efflux pump permease subunit
MTVLPIVGRELRVASRRRGTYWMRVIAAFFAIVAFSWMMLTLYRDAVPSTAHGRHLFRTLFAFAFVYCLFVGARVTADCLSEEKREGTLGLLFLTDLKGYDVVLGKLVATSLNSVYGLLAIIPVMALTVQLGGVTAGELWRASLVLLNTLFFSLTAGLFVSTLSRDERKAMFATVFASLVLVVGPFALSFVLGMSFPLFDDPNMIWPILIFSPAYSFGHILFAAVPFMPFPPESFWSSLLLVHLVSWGLLAVACIILPRIWQARTSSSRLERQRERIEQWAFGAPRERVAHRTRLLDINPFLWLAGRERWKPAYVWFYLAAVAGTWLWGWHRYSDVMFDRKTLIPTVLMFQVFLKIWIVSEACNRLAEDRRIGALELLLSTPLTVSDILRGQWLALKRQFALPVATVVALELVVLRSSFATGTVAVNLVMLVADLAALGWVAMWLGLTARNTSRAILGAVGRILILPWVIFYAGGMAADFLSRFLRGRPFEPGDRWMLWAWLAIGLSTNFAFAILWARRNLLHHFRTVAVQRFEPRRRSWIAWLFPREAVEPARTLAVVSKV